MNPDESDYREGPARPPVTDVPLSHVSLELGHLYHEDLIAGPEVVARRMRVVAPWAEAARQACVATVGAGKAARIATCFLVDDYSAPFGAPAEVIPLLMKCAQESGLTIDYIARESALVEAGVAADGVALADLVERRLVSAPPPGTNGDRPPTAETGWLCNGQRTPHREVTQAMASVPAWLPPTEHAADGHSIFVDVELWDYRGTEQRRWARAFLSAVWQLLRLGVLRYRGAPVAQAEPVPDPLPQEWGSLPVVTRTNPKATPFCAYRTMSVLENRDLPTETAVRTILSQFAGQLAVVEHTAARAAAEGLPFPTDVLRRLEYVFVGD